LDDIIFLLKTLECVSKMACLNWYSQTGASGIWNQEVADHDDYCGWPCVCGHPHRRTPYSWTMQWVYPKLWHCCIQQNLSFLVGLWVWPFSSGWYVWSVSVVVLLQELWEGKKQIDISSIHVMV